MIILNWKERPFVNIDQMVVYSARDRTTAKKYGAIVRAIEISNRDYGHRYKKFSSSRTMQPPPNSHIHIQLGYLVVRKLDTPDQYETWIPSCVFDDLYVATGNP